MVEKKTYENNSKIEQNQKNDTIRIHFDQDMDSLNILQDTIRLRNLKMSILQDFASENTANTYLKCMNRFFQSWNTYNNESMTKEDISIYTKAYQIWLNYMWYNTWEPDGIYWPKTKNWIIKFQKAYSLQLSWVFDKETLNKYIQVCWIKKNEKILKWQKKVENSIQLDFHDIEWKLWFYKEYAIAKNKNLCSSFAAWCAAYVFQKQWKSLCLEEVNAWEIKDSSLYDSNFKKQKPEKDNIKNAPAWSILTLRFDWTRARETWVSHSMVCLWWWQYMDLFWNRIRKINLNNIIVGSDKKFKDSEWKSFSLTEDSLLLTPKVTDISKNKLFLFPDKKKIGKKSITPYEYADYLKKETWLPKNYIIAMIEKENNFSYDQLTKLQTNIKVTLPVKKIEWMKLTLNNEKANSTSREFFSAISEIKNDVMKFYPWLSNKEYDNIARRSIWILYQETKAWSFFYPRNLAKIIFNINDTTRDVYKNLTGKQDEFSRWLTQIKLNTNLWNNKKLKGIFEKNGIRTWDDLLDPKKSAIATMYFLIEKYNTYIKPMLKDPCWIWNPPKDIYWNKVKRERVTDENCFDYLYYAWNKPSEIIKKTATPKYNEYVVNAKRYESKYLS